MEILRQMSFMDFNACLFVYFLLSTFIFGAITGWVGVVVLNFFSCLALIIWKVSLG